MSGKNVFLPWQDCVGEWCPVFLDLRRLSRTIVGMEEHVKVAPQPPEVFAHLEQVTAAARSSGTEIMERLRT